MGGFCLCLCYAYAYVMPMPLVKCRRRYSSQNGLGLVARLFGSVPGWCTPRFVCLGPKSATPTNHARARSAKKYPLVQRLIYSGID